MNIHTEPTQRQCRVAILMIDQRPFHEVMANYLLDEINVGNNELYRASICSMNSSKESIRHVVHALLAKNKADVFITIGDTCSLVTKEVLDERGGHPTIFVGVRNPVGAGLVNSLERPGFCLSGVIREPAPTLAVAEYFAPLYPAVQSVLIPYTFDDEFLFVQAREIQRYLASIGMHVFIVPIKRDAASVFSTINEYASRIQGLMILEGCFSSGYQEELAYVCWEKCIVLCGNGSYALEAGVACGMSGGMRLMAEEVIKMLRAYWQDQISLGTMPVVSLPDNQEFFGNVDVLRRINIPTEVIERLCSQPNVKRERKWTTPYRE